MKYYPFQRDWKQSIKSQHADLTYSSIMARNTPYSKTKPFQEIAIAARANPLENHFSSTPCSIPYQHSRIRCRTILLFALMSVILFLTQGSYRRLSAIGNLVITHAVQ
jgi:hypothetical protein